MSDRISLDLSPAFHQARPLRARLEALRAKVALALRTVLTRRSLKELDGRALADIGLTAEAARMEARRRPWDLEPPRRAPRPQPKRCNQTAAWLREVVRRRRSRRAIAALDPRMLKDIGVSYAEAEFEANKAFWQM